MPAKPTPVRTLGSAIRATRRQVRWTQAQLGQKCGVCRDVVGRWESDEARPAARSRTQLLAFARALPGDQGTELRARLGDEVLLPASGVDEAILRAAEQLDVTSRTFRVALDAVLEAITRAGLSIADARKVVAPK